MTLIIKNGHIIDPANNIDTIQDLYVIAGKIAAIGHPPTDFNAQQVIDATGLIVCPGLVDLCARLREPGYEHKGNIKTETNAAARAGVTTLCCPPDTNPVIDTPAVIEYIQERAQEVGKAKVVVLAALTQELKGQQLSEMHALKNAGCVGVNNASRAVNSAVMRRAMEYAASADLTVFIDANDPALSADGCAHEGVVSVRLGLPCIPETAETIAVARELQLIQLTGARSHFYHLSSARAVQMIARAQYDGYPITADVTTHHLFLTEMDIGYFNSQCNVRPPLRTQRDMEGLRSGLCHGSISAVCSDHQPHDIDAKLAPFPSSEPGISAIESLLPLTLRLVDNNILSRSEAIAKLTHQPATILGLNAGRLDIGNAADICIFDPERYWECSQQNLISFGKNSPFIGWELKGAVTHTLLDGKLVYQLNRAENQ
ncbi:MAG: dihydroorotase [Gammaproteobacteria bacterium]|nr:dihydroorotase [Gammaproteobacteria bacterium]